VERGDEHLKRLQRLWKLARHAVRKETQSLADLREAMGRYFDEFEISTPVHFEKLRALGEGWTGFGSTLGSEVALFFRAGDIVDIFPNGVLDMTYETVPSMLLRSIPSGVREFKPCAATPGAGISWSGGGCHPGHHFDRGTLGVFLKDESGNPWIVSANHVISRNHACVDNVVELPGCCAVSRQIESIRIRDYGTLNLADAAVGRWDSAIPPQPQPEEMPPLTANIMSPQEAKGLIATKVAMPGKRIQGRVAYIGKCVLIDMRDILPYQAQFADQILIEDIPREDKLTFSHPGDSGSLVVHEADEESQPLGILIAYNAPMCGDEKPAARYSAVTPMATVLNGLGQVAGHRFEIMTQPA